MYNNDYPSQIIIVLINTLICIAWLMILCVSKLRFYIMVCNKSTRYKGCFSTWVSGEQRSKHITVGVCYVDHNRQRAYLFYFTPFYLSLSRRHYVLLLTFLPVLTISYITRYLITSCCTPLNPKSPLTRWHNNIFKPFVCTRQVEFSSIRVVYLFINIL